MTRESATELLTVTAAAAAMSVSKPTAYRLMASGQLEWVQVGAHRRITRAAIRRFVAAHTERASA